MLLGLLFGDEFYINSNELLTSSEVRYITPGGVQELLRTPYPIFFLHNERFVNDCYTFSCMSDFT